MSNNHQALRAMGLHKQYGNRWVVSDVDIEVNKGEIIGYIIGVPLEYFKQESWAHFDINLGKNSQNRNPTRIGGSILSQVFLFKSSNKLKNILCIIHGKIFHNVLIDKIGLSIIPNL